MADYIYQNAIGSGSSIWMYHGSKAEHLLYFLTGEGAQITFSAYSYVVAATLGAALLAVLVWGNAASRIRAVALSLATACAYAVPTLNKVKTPFFGLGFELLLLFCALLSLRFLFSGPWAKGRLFRLTVGGALVVLAGIGLKSSAPCFNWGTRGDGRLGSVEQTCREILQAMKSTEAGRPVKVFLTMHARPINQDTLQWLSRTSGCAYQFVAPALEQIDLDQVKLEMENSLFVLAFDSLSQDSSFDYPSEHLAPATLRLARSLSCLSEVAAFPSFDGTVYHLFKNRFFFGNFGGWSCQEGLNPLEGPYPQWDLPFPVRWGTGSQTRLCLENRDGCPLRLLLSCRTDVAGQVLTICLDGQAVADCAVPASASFRDFDVLLPIREKGQHEVTIRYAVPDSRPQSGGRVVLYKSLQVQAVDPSPSAEPPRG
ncbi:MAG: hypothetical protein JO112_05875 [Planctomycetes bacterium]|nr:hypothetical protein [Planctomycetota bacterium]